MKKYYFSDFKVIKTSYSFKLEYNEEANKEQVIIFEKMLNIGYTFVNEGDLILSDIDIVNFWNMFKKTILKDIDINKYYAIFGLPDFFQSRKPYIKINGAVHTDNFKMTIVWALSVNNYGAVEPFAYKRNGLVLYDFEEKELGSIYPEYIKLYNLVEDANLKWKNLEASEKKVIIKNLIELSKIKEFYIPTTFYEVLGGKQI